MTEIERCGICGQPEPCSAVRQVDADALIPRDEAEERRIHDVVAGLPDGSLTISPDAEGEVEAVVRHGVEPTEFVKRPVFAPLPIAFTEEGDAQWRPTWRTATYRRITGRTYQRTN